MEQFDPSKKWFSQKNQLTKDDREIRMKTLWLHWIDFFS